MAIATTNPATGDVVKTFQPHSDAEVDARIARAMEAFETLRAMDIANRAALMHKAGEITKEREEDMARLMTLEMGKPILQARGEAAKCALVCYFYADHAESYLSDDVVEFAHARAYRKYLPLGPVLAVMPWNYPFWQVYRFIAPALMAGNVGLLKHASNVPQCALMMEEIFREAGFPIGCFQTLLIGGSRVERVLRDERVRAATLTGSEPAGSAVASVCGELIKPTVLELGGSDAFIVMPSADLDRAVEIGIKARTQNNGQSCIAAKRFIIDADIYDDFRDRFVAEIEALTIGDPMEEDTDIGPLVDMDARDEIVGQVDAAVKAGATLVTGGKALERPGSFMSPGVLENIPHDSAAYSEEIFGPVALFFKANGIEDALRIANDSPFGLGGAVFTENEVEMMRVVDDLESGATFVNSMTASDPRLPFGGIKRSGYGRELASEGIREFCNVKTVSIAKL